MTDKEMLKIVRDFRKKMQTIKIWYYKYNKDNTDRYPEAKND